MNPQDTLTPREFEMVALLARGLRYRDIAGDVGITRDTVVNHFKAIRRKTGMENMVSVAVWFVRRFPTEDDEAVGYEACCVRYMSRWTDRKSYGMGGLGK